MINLYIRKYPEQGVAIWLCWASRMFSYNPAFYPECDNYTAQISLRYLWLFTGEKRYFRPEKKNSKELIVDFRRRKSSSGPSQSILRMLISGQTQRFLQPLSGGWNAGERPRGARTGPGLQQLLAGENLTLSQSSSSVCSQHTTLSPPTPPSLPPPPPPSPPPHSPPPPLHHKWNFQFKIGEI